MKHLALIVLLALVAPAAFAIQTAPDDAIESDRTWLAEQRRMNQRFVELFRERRYEEGEELARSLLLRAEENYGYDSTELLAPLINLATVQRVQRRYSDALFHYERHIAIAGRSLGYDALELVNPLHGMARTHIRMGDYEAAIEPLARALRITHANSGIYSLEQGATRDLLSDLALAEGDLEQANLHQRVQVRAHERRYGPGDLRTVPALYKLGEWYERTRQTALQRRAYAAADRIIQSASGEDSLERVQALRGQASSFLRESRREKAEEFFRRALSIVRAHPIQDILQQARLLIDIGDTQTIFNRQPNARETYREAWELLSVDDEALDLRAELLQNPVIPLRSARLPVQVPREMSNSSRYESQPRAGSIVLQLTIEQDGTVSGAQVMESNPPGMIDEIAVALIKGAKFRPQMRDGEPVRVEDVIYRHRFRWYKRRDPEPVDEMPAPSEPDDEERPLEVPGAAAT
ncbi:MAG: TonB family protein [Gammaproteobacteria bacterium]|nr:TonB family protein [Gammaproteobacteria bacterium]